MDFADVRNYPPSQYDGIVVFRLADDVVAEIFLRESAFVEKLQGRLAIVESDRVRFRPPLQP